MNDLELNENYYDLVSAYLSNLDIEAKEGDFELKDNGNGNVFISKWILDVEKPSNEILKKIKKTDIDDNKSKLKMKFLLNELQNNPLAPIIMFLIQKVEPKKPVTQVIKDILDS